MYIKLYFSWSNLLKSKILTTPASSFREATSHTFPPDQIKAMMGMISNLCKKMEKMEEKFEDLMS